MVVMLGGSQLGKVTLRNPDGARERKRYLAMNHQRAKPWKAQTYNKLQAHFRLEHHASEMVCELI